MALLWLPNTCRLGQCVFEIEVEPGIEDAPTKFVRAIALCDHHRARRNTLSSDSALFDAVLATNRRKNFATYEVAKELAKATMPNSPDAADVLHDSIPWRIDDQDRVIVTTTLAASRRSRLQAAVDGLFGTGKVVLE